MRGGVFASTAMVAALSAGPLWAAGSEQVVYAAAPAWTLAPLSGSEPKQEAAVPFARLADDEQVRFTAEGYERHIAVRTKALNPEVLGELGNVSVEWDPATQVLTINRLAIIRDGRTIDLLPDNRFQVLRRERNLEESMLDGRLTAALQAPDLRVGDTLDFAYTIKADLPLLSGRNGMAVRMLAATPTGASRQRVLWDRAAPVRWRLGANLPTPKVSETPSGGELLLEATGQARPKFPSRAPHRFAMADYAQYSQAGEWRDISALFWPLFDKAASLAPNSPLKAEVERIRAAGKTPEERVSLALRLVEEQVRYVAITMDAQGYLPAAADETWKRRFGDCKGKTALLVALLRELGVEAQAALVASNDGEALAETLPSAAAFDHVIVKARIGDRVYWLDGTRMGDTRIEAVEAPQFSYALPLAPGGADLERIEQPRLDEPHFQTIVKVDASGGLLKTSPVEATVLLRGDDGLAIARGLTLQDKDRAERALLEEYGDQWSWAKMTSASWRWDADAGLLTVTMLGEGDLVAAKDPEPHVDIPGGDRVPVRTELRPADENQGAPYRVPYPVYYRDVSIVKMPLDLEAVELFGDPIDEQVGGYEYTRSVSWAGREYAVVNRSLRTLAPEITATDAAEAVKVGKAWEEKGRARMEAHHAGIRALTARGKLTRAKLAALDGPEAWSAGGEAYRAGDYRMALAAYDVAAREGVVEPTLIIDRGQALFASKRYGEVLSLLAAEESRLGRVRFMGLWLKVLAQEEQDGAAAALATLDQEIAARPTVGAYALRAQHIGASDEPRAVRDLEAAGKLQATAPQEEEMIAKSWRSAGRPDESVKAMRRAIRLAPEDRELREALADLLLSEGRHGEALKAYEDGLRVSPLAARMLTGRAEVLALLGRAEEASAQLDETIRLLRIDRDAVNGVCWIRATRNLDPAKGLAECDRWLKVFPKDGVLLDSRGFAKLRLGRNAEALADYEQAVKLAPEQADSLYGRGVARIRTGARAAGEADIAAAEEADPGIGARWKTYDLAF